MKLKREHIVPGLTVSVKENHTLILDAYRYLFGESKGLPGGRFLTVVAGPRKVEGINLVRVKIDEYEFEVYYCDLLRECEG